MKILAIDSSKKQAQISLFVNKQSFVHFMDESKSHSEFLLKEIEDFLTLHNTTIQEIDFLSVNVGPGSFTGIRIGISFVKAFMCALNQKSVVVNNFELIDFNIKNKPQSYFVVLGSNNADFYFAKYENGKVSYGFTNKENLNKITSNSSQQVFCSVRECEIFDGVNNLVGIVVEEDSFIKISKQKVENGEFALINEISPLYIKKSQAEIGLLQKIDQNLKILEQANIKDLSVLEQKCFEDAYSETLLKADLENQNRHKFFAYFDNELVGYINFEKTFDEINLFKICVLEEFREYGIATKLMQKMIEFFENDKNLKSIFLEVDSANKSAIKLYEKFGFKQISSRKKYYKNGDDALIFELKK